MVKQVKHVHKFGEGYFNVVNGKRVLHIQLCKECGERVETKVEDEQKPKGPRVYLTSGENVNK